MSSVPASSQNLDLIFMNLTSYSSSDLNARTATRSLQAIRNLPRANRAGRRARLAVFLRAPLPIGAAWISARGRGGRVLSYGGVGSPAFPARAFARHGRAPRRNRAGGGFAKARGW